MSNTYDMQNSYEQKEKTTALIVANLVNGYGSSAKIETELMGFEFYDAKVVTNTESNNGTDYLSAKGFKAVTEVNINYPEHGYCVEYLIEHEVKTPLEPFIHEEGDLKEYLNQELEVRILIADIKVITTKNPVIADVILAINTFSNKLKETKKAMTSAYMPRLYTGTSNKIILSNHTLDIINKSIRADFYRYVISRPEFKTVYR